MKKRTKRVFFAIIAIILIMVTVFFMNPLRRSENSIRRQILSKIPLGTNMEEAILIIQKHPKWEIYSISNKIGFSLIQGIPGDPIKMDETIIGTQYIRIDLGDYRTIIWCNVVAYLGFDDEGKLIEVSVRKDYDSV